jgi:hypothetical protein
MGLWDKLIDVGVDALKKGADALTPTEEETDLHPIEAMARAGWAAIARGFAEEIRTPHCEALTRQTMGHMLRCGKTATMRHDGAKFCAACAPESATPLNVETR